MERQKMMMFPILCWIITLHFTLTLSNDIPSGSISEHLQYTTNTTYNNSEEVEETTISKTSENDSTVSKYGYLTFSTEIFVEDSKLNEDATVSEKILNSTKHQDSNNGLASSAFNLGKENVREKMAILYESTTEHLQSPNNQRSIETEDYIQNSTENLYYNELAEKVMDYDTSMSSLSERFETTASTKSKPSTEYMTTLKKDSESTTTLESNPESRKEDNAEVSHTQTDEILSYKKDSGRNLTANKTENAEKFKESTPVSSEDFRTELPDEMEHNGEMREEFFAGSKQNDTVTEEAVTTENIPSVRNLGSSNEMFKRNESDISEISDVNKEMPDEHKEVHTSSIRPEILKEISENPNEIYEHVEASVTDDRKTNENKTDDLTEDPLEWSASNINSDEVFFEATELNNNSTRIPKRIQENQDRYPEGRMRPARPDPGYSHRQEADLVRPYRPDSPLNQYPYYRPTPDYRTPLIRQDTDFTRPARPDPDFPRASFRPNYSYSKPSVDGTDSSRQSSSDSGSSKPYKPSFSRPYHPQTSFGRPYRPDYQRPTPRPADDPVVAPKSTTDFKGISYQEPEGFEHSRADYDYTKQSEVVPEYPKTFLSDTRPSQLKPDITKPFRPSYDTITDSSIHSKTPEVDVFTENRDSIKLSKPDIATGKPGSSYYPRPGFGHNYQTSDTSVRPFSVGTVTSAKNITRVEFIKADCFDNHMKVTMRFNGTFNGLVYSSGYAQDSSCSYVNGSGRNHYEFFIRLNRCGTLGQQEVAEQRAAPTSRRRQERAQYLVNTVTVQYNPVIEEDIDEHFRVTCEYGYDFWKTVTFPVVNVESSAVKVRTGSPVVFTLPPPQCNMEIRSGFGPSGNRITGPVNVGDPLTLVIHMKSESTGFDILVSNCFAHNGAQKRMQLIDSNGCVVQEKLVSPFRGVSSPDRSQQVTLYSYLKAFRFTGSPALYIECDVHMCHGSCPPQRCYWRHLYKRSAQEVTPETTTQSGGVMSESVSLFQSLEVRHEEADAPNQLALRPSTGRADEDMVCIKTGGFAAIFACLLLLLLLAAFISICLCLRMRKLKSYVEAPDTKHFVEFDVHVPIK
ncbi:uncharacterized protein LOC118180911 isoform X2 [Stegodyphus dumicola]|uniref:uncharacterized protein LOC118180911 isoform X2 n=1 Tax=Stegodyphus dumicola TaxID=202533 RepID=UPI0015ABA63A|nr:uncharacterized protein LOC118180911 isoform X2 [Stegodyphus dumicola]